jgi:hypothetical protein
MLLTAVGALAVAGSARAEVPEADPVPTASTAPAPTGTIDDVSGELDAYGPFVVQSGKPLTASVTLTNAATDPVPEVSASLSITKQPLSTRDELAEFFDDPSSQPMREVTSTIAGKQDVDADDEPLETGTLAPGANAQVRLAATTADLALPVGTAGVYGVTATYTVGKSTVVVDSMAMTWLDTDIPSLPVTAIATAAGQPSRVSALLEAARIAGVAVVVDPSSLTSAAPVDLLDGREVYLLPSTHPDVASLAHAGDTTLVNFALEQSRARTWTGLADAPWLAVSAVADRSVVGWADGTGAAATLFDSEFASESPEVPTVDNWVPAVMSVAIGDDGQAPLIVPDAVLSDLVASFRPSDPSGPSRIVAESALLAMQGDGSQGVVVSPGLSWIVGSDGPSPNLDALMKAPWVTARTLADTIDDPRRGEDTLPNAQGASEDLPVENVEGLSARLSSLTRLAQTADNPSSLLAPGGRVLLNAVSSAARADADRQGAAYRASTTSVDATLGAVGIVQSSDVNLIATSGEVPITIHNDLGVDSTVTVVMRSTSPNLQVRDQPVVTVPAGAEIIAMIPVEAVSTADVTINVSLINADGDSVSEAQNFTMRVRADWGNAATAVFTGLLALVMVAGIIRTIRRGRKDTRTGPTEPSVIETTAADSEHDD